MPRSRSRSRSYSRSVSSSYSSHRDKKYSRSHKSSSRYKSSRKKSHERDRHRKSSHSKHYRKRSSSRSRSTSRDSRHSSASNSSNSSTTSTEKSRKKLKETPVALAVVPEKLPNFASVENLGSNITAKVFQELNEDTFSAKTFTSSGLGAKKSPSSSIVFDITSNPTVQLQKPALPEAPEDTLFHQNLYGNDVARMEKWVKKLYVFRQKAAGKT